jgi:RHS repeat-associated protein
LPFGQADVSIETVENNLRFPGQYFDLETGLHYNWHRYYDPETGRYLTPDPIGLAEGMNLYAYVQNDPVNLIDPEGLSPAGWIIKLTKSGFQKISSLGSSSAARQARRQGENVLAPNRQAAKAIERGAFGGGEDVLRHTGHDLQDGSKGMPHFQTDGKYGHTFWGSLLGFAGSLLDPFDAISGDLAGPEDDMMPLPEYNSSCK